MIRVWLPVHLRRLALSNEEVVVHVDSPVTQSTLLDAVECKYPTLRGTIRDYGTKQRRPFLRFFANGIDVSLESPHTLLPDVIVTGEEPFMIIGAIAGG